MQLPDKMILIWQLTVKIWVIKVKKVKIFKSLEIVWDMPKINISPK